MAVLNSQKAQLFDFCVRPGADWYIQAVKGAHAMLRAAGYAVEVIGDVFTVHGLESSFADGLDDWVVLKFLMKIERKLGYDSRNA